MITQDYSGSMHTSPPTQETIRKAATLMKYFEITAYTNCGATILEITKEEYELAFRKGVL